MPCQKCKVHTAPPVFLLLQLSLPCGGQGAGGAPSPSSTFAGWQHHHLALLRNAITVACDRRHNACLIALLATRVPLPPKRLLWMMRGGQEQVVGAILRHPTCRKGGVNEGLPPLAVKLASQEGVMPSVVGLCVQLGLVGGEVAAQAMADAAWRGHVDVVGDLAGLAHHLHRPILLLKVGGGRAGGCLISTLAVLQYTLSDMRNMSGMCSLSGMHEGGCVTHTHTHVLTHAMWSAR